ncbi:hypothetical protein B0H16DRAFT_1457290 [Mycena metata]|uniref:Uncharacterized protein n=1 Tax=Mycena metata TaxID=1033252 RepID=A0AAD7J6L7_9AGAR|nr:hypothetical protein B0H16DRAFT_1457290 [Mycena metata]
MRGTTEYRTLSFSSARAGRLLPSTVPRHVHGLGLAWFGTALRREQFIWGKKVRHIGTAGAGLREGDLRARMYGDMDAKLSRNKEAQRDKYLMRQLCYHGFPVTLLTDESLHPSRAHISGAHPQNFIAQCATLNQGYFSASFEAAAVVNINFRRYTARTAIEAIVHRSGYAIACRGLTRPKGNVRARRMDQQCGSGTAGGGPKPVRARFLAWVITPPTAGHTSCMVSCTPLPPAAHRVRSPQRSVAGQAVFQTNARPTVGGHPAPGFLCIVYTARREPVPARRVQRGTAVNACRFGSAQSPVACAAWSSAPRAVGAAYFHAFPIARPGAATPGRREPKWRYRRVF